MTCITSKTVWCKSVGETRNCSVSFADLLEGDELLNGTPTVVADPTGPTITDKLRNASAITIDGESVAVDKAVTFKVAGGTADVTYELLITVTTNEDQTLQWKQKLKVVAS